MRTTSPLKSFGDEKEEHYLLVFGLFEAVFLVLVFFFVVFFLVVAFFFVAAFFFVRGTLTFCPPTPSSRSVVRHFG